MNLVFPQARGHVQRQIATALLVVGTIALAGGGPLPRNQPVPRPPSQDIAATVFLIGDAGEPARGGEPVLDALTREIGDGGARTTVVFLGDNIYPSGMPDSAAPDRADSERKIDAQIDVIRTSGARGIIVPGNHDWDEGSPDGWEAVRREERHVRLRGGNRIAFAPRDGCPGPSVVDGDSTFRLVLLDTQWWLQKGPKPENPNSTCPADSELEVMDSLRVALAGAGPRRVMVLAHHPLVSGGPHGGHFDWTDHVFPLRHLARWLWLPLPVIGSAYPLARGMGVSPQDMPNATNRRMRHELEQVLSEHPPLVYGSGHDHNLQVLRGGTSASFLLVSGGGFFGHPYPVTPTPATLFATSAKGFMRLDFLSDGRVHLNVIAVREGPVATEEFSAWLTDLPSSTGNP